MAALLLHAAWARYYTVDHVKTLMKRSAATGGQVPNVLFLSTWFTGGILIENVHPLECGAVRKKFTGRPAALWLQDRVTACISTQNTGRRRW